MENIGEKVENLGKINHCVLHLTAVDGNVVIKNSSENFAGKISVRDDIAEQR